MLNVFMVQILALSSARGQVQSNFAGVKTFAHRVDVSGRNDTN
jgi:hypothetical protein